MDFASLRQSMVDNQLRTNEVFDLDVLAAMSRLPREAFVASSKKSLAYSDHAVPVIGDAERLMMAPTAAARLVQLCNPKPDDFALVVGCGAGFTAALIGELASSVVAIESSEAMVSEATSVLSELGTENVVVVEADLEAGLPDEAPYDLILIDGAVDFVPEGLFGQLRDGGRLVAVVGEGLSAPAMIYHRSGETVSGAAAFNLAIPHLPGFRKAAEFVF